MRHWQTLVAMVVVASFAFIDPAVAACHIAAFEASAYNIGESGGTVTVKVELQGRTSSCAGTVHYKTENNSALGGQDFQHKEGDVTFVAGDDREESIEIPINEDGAVEGDESFSINLSNPTGSIESTGTPTTVVIQDNDQAAPPPRPPSPAKTSPSPPPPSPGAPVAVPTPSPSPTLSPSPSPTTLAKAKESGGFPVAGIIAIVALVLAAGAGGLLYWIRKRPT